MDNRSKEWYARKHVTGDLYSRHSGRLKCKRPSLSPAAYACSVCRTFSWRGHEFTLLYCIVLFLLISNRMPILQDKILCGCNCITLFRMSFLCFRWSVYYLSAHCSGKLRNHKVDTRNRAYTYAHNSCQCISAS